MQLVDISRFYLILLLIRMGIKITIDKNLYVKVDFDT